MITVNSLKSDWIHKLRKISGRKSLLDPSLIEKMIYAFYLLEQLSLQKIDFIFKGGTSLLLITKESNRFSVDIDIWSQIERKKLEKALDNIITNSEFVRFNLDNKRSYDNAELPKAHYKFIFNSDINHNENVILLDIMFQENDYPEIQESEIKSEWLNSEDPHLTVKLPTIDSILGDKLTAFAPTTTGVPYGVNKELEIIKQLFDVTMLIDLASDFNIADKSFKTIALNQINFRKLSITTNDVLDDILNTAVIISKRNMNKGQDLDRFNEIRAGLRSFTNYTIKDNFRIEQAVEASSKAAWIAMKLKNQNLNSVETYSDSIDLTDKSIKNSEYGYLDKLKKSNKQAFYYWYRCLEEINLIE